ncbi:hypothetical protein TCAL_01665 [Tigriopus californicus]|uniref:ubiquitinyl hydrolase 1 n=1 Tax=Tigriopus californicus TaxID=6832 RepID=A0A553P9Z5_TIGCA|nr:ubiquitin carboxyl-terminal hydrolase 10-like [Tigriopus californicus]TRY74502.1 hypothetical protein TCAL_01665 [Tigriopus californicus]|eukprot:TCALIF_01665-PA protein Name:"Similar to usp10 Ubiquitin carboxyl-terminal hydrolase 10 (Xenopus tropicalis)" AED:0.24 eAED:0.24 QI:0/-1/0/1/-1/1/1/0/1026
MMKNDVATVGTVESAPGSARSRPLARHHGLVPETGGSGLDFLNWEDCTIDEKKRLDRILYQNAWTRTPTPTASPGPPAGTPDAARSASPRLSVAPIENQTGLYDDGCPPSGPNPHPSPSLGPPGYPSYENLVPYDCAPGDPTRTAASYPSGSSGAGSMPNIPVSNPPVSYAPYPNFIINNVTANVNVHPAPPTSMPLPNNPSVTSAHAEGVPAPPVSMMVGSPGAAYSMPTALGPNGALPSNGAMMGSGVPSLMPNTYSPPMVPGHIYHVPSRPYIYGSYPSPQYVSVELAHSAGPMGHHSSPAHSNGPMGNAYGSPTVSQMNFYQQPPPVTQPIANRPPLGHPTNQYQSPPHHHHNPHHQQPPMTSHLAPFSKPNVPLLQPHLSPMANPYPYYPAQPQHPPQLQPHVHSAQPSQPLAPPSLAPASYTNPSVPPTMLPDPNPPAPVAPPELVYASNEIHPDAPLQTEIPSNDAHEVNGEAKPTQISDEKVAQVIETIDHPTSDNETEEEPHVEEGTPSCEPKGAVLKEGKDGRGVTSAQPAPSWASLLFQNSGGDTAPPAKVDRSAASSSEVAKPMARVQPYTSGQMNGEAKPSVEDHTLLGKMATFFTNYNLNHKSLSVMPRGLTNHNNWCFTNAILQALVACPPFYNLMRALPMYEDPLPNQAANVVVDMSGVKILKSVWDFVNQFEVMTNFPKLNRSKSKKTEDFPLGKSFEASSIYNMLLNLNNDTFKVIEGRQEDAEEFLTFLLNGINDEMMSILKAAEEAKNGPSNTDEGQANDEHDSAQEGYDSDEWKEVGPNNRSCVTRRHTLSKTPLADIFQGQIRSCVQHSAAEPTATLQPFFTLPLDLQLEGTTDVAQALVKNFATEPIQGFVCPTTNKVIAASRNLSLEELPPILILHMKRFVYTETSGGCQKLLKHVNVSVGLEISRDILSVNSRNKYQTRQRSYKLFAVVYHKGAEATKGHYVTDVYHTGLASWLRCDDAVVHRLTDSNVLNQDTNSVPYILFYRRGDTMGGNVPDKSNNKT